MLVAGSIAWASTSAYVGDKHRCLPVQVRLRGERRRSAIAARRPLPARASAVAGKSGVCRSGKKVGDQNAAPEAETEP